MMEDMKLLRIVVMMKVICKSVGFVFFSLYCHSAIAKISTALPFPAIVLTEASDSCPKVFFLLLRELREYTIGFSHTLKIPFQFVVRAYGVFAHLVGSPALYHENTAFH